MADRPHRVILVGARCRCSGRLTSEAGAGGYPRDAIAYVATAEEAARLLAGTLRDGDVVLFKGSRAVGLDRAVELLAGTGSGKRESGRS